MENTGAFVKQLGSKSWPLGKGSRGLRGAHVSTNSREPPVARGGRRDLGAPSLATKSHDLPLRKATHAD
eukprot:5532223-Pyramimonas_sp.AAC.1